MLLLAFMLTSMLTPSRSLYELHLTVETDLMIIRAHTVRVDCPHHSPIFFTAGHVKGIKGQCAFLGFTLIWIDWPTLTHSLVGNCPVSHKVKGQLSDGHLSCDISILVLTTQDRTSQRVCGLKAAPLCSSLC